MSDDQELRETLSAAVPTPPETGTWGRESRELSRRRRRGRVAAGLAAVALVAAAVPLRHVVHHDNAEPVVGGIVTQASGREACAELRGTMAGLPMDRLVVDRTTAGRWLDEIGNPGALADWSDHADVTVCLTDARGGSVSVVVTQQGRQPYVVTRGTDFRAILPTMTKLEVLRSDGSAVSDAPFRCPGPDQTPDPDVSSGLPAGATGALLCYGNETLYSPQTILSGPGVDDVVLAIDRAPLSYLPTNFICSPGDVRAYSIVVRYPSGTRTVTMDPCRGLEVGTFTRHASDDLDLRFERWLLQDGPVDPFTPLTCPTSGQEVPTGTGDLRHVVHARWCPAGGSQGVDLTGRDLATVVSWSKGIQTYETGPDRPCRRPTAGWPSLALQDAWGNQFAVSIECGRRFVSALTSARPRHSYYAASLGDRPLERLIDRLDTGG